MAIALRSSSASGTSDTNGTSCVVPVPAGAQAGDIALLAMEHWDTFDGTGITFPAGFTVVINGQFSGNREKLYVAWKRLTGADTGNYTVTWTGNQWNMGHCLMLSGGLASGNPIESSNSNLSTGTSLPSMAVVAAAPGDFMAHFIANQNSGSGTPPTGPVAMTEVLDGNYLKSNYVVWASSGTFNPTGGSTVSSAKSGALLAIKPSVGGGPVSQAMNTATETDTSQSVGKRKTRATAFPTETDTSVSITRRKTRGVALAAETDTSRPITRSKRKTVQLVTETDLALPIGIVSGRAINAATETDTARPFGEAKRKAIGTAVETDSALFIDSNMATSVPVTFPTETDQALPIGYVRSRPVGTALELDEAGAFSFVNPAWRLVMPSVTDRYTMRGSLSTTILREKTVFGDENGLFTVEQGSPSEGTDEYGAIPFGTKYIWYGGHVNVTDDPAIKNLWLAHGYEVENVQL